MEPRNLSANVEARQRPAFAIREAIEGLRRTPRVAPRDRALLASNLGAMLVKRIGGRSARTMRTLFADAFAGAEGEANYRKRKRYLRLAGEETRSPAAE